MKIDGIKQLDQNYYETITVRDGIIRVSGKILDTVNMNKSFTDSLRGKSDEEIRLAIIDYFIRYNKVNFLSDEFSRLTGPNFCAGSESGKLLIINDKASEIEKTKVLNKFISDRYRFLFNYPSLMYGLTINYGKTSSYSVSRNGNPRFNLSRVGGKLPNYEIEFISEFIDQVFDNELIEVIKPKNEDKYNSNYELKSKSKRVILGILDKEILKKVDEHNKKCLKSIKESEVAKKMQLKMEGF